MALEIKIQKKISGDSEHKIISVRLPNEMVSRLEELAGEANRSRNDIINLLLEAALVSVKVEAKSAP